MSDSFDVNSLVPMAVPLVAVGGITYYFHKKIDAQKKEFDEFKMNSEMMIKDLIQEIIALRKKQSILEKTFYEMHVFQNDDEEEDEEEEIEENEGNEGIEEEDIVINVIEKPNRDRENIDRISEMSDTELEYIIPEPVTTFDMINDEHEEKEIELEKEKHKIPVDDVVKEEDGEKEKEKKMEIEDNIVYISTEDDKKRIPEPEKDVNGEEIWVLDNKVWNRKTKKYITKTSSYGKKCLKELKSDNLI